MKSKLARLLCTIVGLVAVLGSAPQAVADDSEVFTSSAFVAENSILPNVLFIMDTSGSMDAEVTVYDPTKTYSGACTGYIYWSVWQRRGVNDVPPDCSTSTQKFSEANNRCREAYLGFTDGYWSGTAQQFNSDGTRWQNLVAGADRKVECGADNDKHGDVDASSTHSGSASSTAKRARNGTYATRWGTSSTGSPVDWSSATTYNFYSANYANWYWGDDEGSRKTRLEIVQDVAAEMIDTLEGVNLGLMRYSMNKNGDAEDVAQGGMVTYPISTLTASTRAEMKAQVRSWTHAGYTPLSETYYEAYQYLSGGEVVFGQSSRLYPGTGGEFPSVAGSRENNDSSSANYQSPIRYSCQKTFIVYLTDGLPTNDTEASEKIEALPNFEEDGFVPTAEGGNDDGGCPDDGPGGDPGSDYGDGRCMVNLAAYLFNHDVNDEVLGKQNVKTYVVGFGDTIAASADYLQNIAAAGGGEAYTQTDAAGLKAAFAEIFAEVAEGADSTFVSPTVAVNAFNRTRNLNSLYVSVFAPSNRYHWPGNVKKYQLVDGVISGGTTENPTPAVDPATGFFAEGSSDMFPGGGADGADVTKGGAAVNLPAYGSRKVYTYLGNKDLTATANAFTVGNTTNITAALLGVTETRRTDVIEHTLGKDVNNDDNDASTTNRYAMGDPMHARPAVAIYGGSESAPQGLVFTTTNDGMLHALDMNSGEEQWAFIPQELMTRLGQLQRDPIMTNRTYGIDGDVRIFKYDVDGDGTIETGDKMYLVFGFGRGGAVYYALDVTAQAAPRVLWKKTVADLPALGRAWSAPVITRVNVNTTLQTDAQKFVVIFGGGYDTGQENYNYSTDGSGNAVYMLELATGNLLWSAGITSSGANWEHPFMNNSIPSEIAVLDLNGDSFADRMYFGDMGGRIWRLDIWHGQAPNNLASGGLLATLGAGHLENASDDDNIINARRFYYAPDVSVVTPRGSAPFMNIAIGSGYRGHPLDTEIRDRFYSIRDYEPFNRRTNTSFNAPWEPITDDELVDVTTDVATPVVDGDKGWKIRLAENNGTLYRGEKVLAESVTVNGVIFFPTFTPTGVDDDNPCLPTMLNRTWAVYLDSARPFGLRDAEDPDAEGTPDNVDDPSDRYIRDAQGGIAPGTSVVQTGGKTVCLKGVATHKCVDIGDVTRTYWERRQ
ncbi:MAG TPA: hypothetical protein VFV88_07835 [Steroidobacteraceae bacterium]|jgi:type IV pilus assembly protein PilY1|nr:hypothetical protein [Steroidobacteraceae bacterium]